MSMKRFCAGLYRFFSWPIRMMCKYFSKKEEPAIKKTIDIPDGIVRVLVLENDLPILHEARFKTRFKPLFLPNYINEAKNDKDFTKAREMARKKEERMKYRKELMDRLKKLDEEEGIKPKPKTPTPSNDSD